MARATPPMVFATFYGFNSKFGLELTATAKKVIGKHGVAAPLAQLFG